jgi:short-subunit dehydrogenase
MAQTEDFTARYGPWALITGAARGLGTEFARLCAARGLSLVLADRLEDELRAVAERISQESGAVAVRTVCCDLAQPGFLEAIRAATDGLEIGLLICNAGLSHLGPFLDRPLENLLESVDINVRATLMLTHTYAQSMRGRRRGGIILLSSASAQQGTSMVANYAATKAYNHVLAEGLWVELQPYGIDVLGFLPGSTRTPGFLGSNPRLDRAGIVPLMDADVAAREALDALGKTPSLVAGRLNRFLFSLLGLIPKAQRIRIMDRTMRNMYRR